MLFSSVLESHHSAYAFKLTIGPSFENVNIFKNLDRETYRDVRQSIIDMVLATDMTKHFEHIAKFMHVKRVSMDEGVPENAAQSQLDKAPLSPNSISITEPENIVLIKRMLIKCADVSNPARPLHLCEIWAKRIAEEYCNQVYVGLLYLFFNKF